MYKIPAPLRLFQINTEDIPLHNAPEHVAQQRRFLTVIIIFIIITINPSETPSFPISPPPKVEMPEPPLSSIFVE